MANYRRENDEDERWGQNGLAFFSVKQRDGTKKEKHSATGIAITCVTVLFFF